MCQIPVAMPIMAVHVSGGESTGAVLGVPVGASVDAPLPEGGVRLSWQGPERSYASGVLRHIGMLDFGSWKNPYTMDKVMVRASSVENGMVEMVVDHDEPKYFQTQDVPNSWVEIHFGTKFSVRPTAYTMCAFEGASAKDCPQYWVLEAQQRGDEEQWTVLSEHNGDTTLATASSKPGTWMINTDDFFRKFRVRMTGPTAGLHHRLGVSCIEFHGDLLSH